MKKIIFSLSLLLTFLIGAAQYPPINRTTGSNTVFDPRLGATRNFFPPIYLDTVEANIPINLGNDSVGALIFTTQEQTYWMRVADPSKRWSQIGGTIVVSTSNSIVLSGDGSTQSPLLAQLIPSGQPGNILQVLADGVFVPTFIQNGRIDGGITSWVSGYTYDVTAATYVINGVFYAAPEVQVTLANSDPTFDRFDLPVLNSNSTISVITGVAADDPQVPAHDPATQIALTPILVTAASTQPTINQEWIYINNVEWTTLSTTPRIDPGSASNPFSPLLDVEATLARNADAIRFTDPSPPTVMSAFNILTFKLRSKAAFAATSRIELRWYDGVNAIGNAIGIGDGTYGFISGQTSSYQTISIPLSQFGAVTSVTSLLITVRTTGGNTIGFYIDDIQLQQAIVPVSGNAWVQGGNFMASLGILGTLDNFGMNIITNNVARISLGTNSITDFKSTNGTTSIANISPVNGGQVRVGSNTATLPAVIINHASGGANTGTLIYQDNSVTQGSQSQTTAFTIHNNFDTHVWRNTSTLTEYGRINSSGEYLINRTDGGDYKLQVTGGVLIDATSKEITLSGLDTDNTATQVLGKDGSGNSVWRDVSTITGASITATNGLSMSTATNVVLGNSALTGNTDILTSAFALTINSSNGTQTLKVNNTSGGSGSGIWGVTDGFGIGVYGEASGAGQGVVGSSIDGNGGFFQSTNQAAISAVGITNTALLLSTTPSSTNSVAPVAQLSRTSTGGGGANGIGVSMDFLIETSSSGGMSNQIISKWTDATHATRTSQFSITGVNSASTNTLLTIDGDGTVTLLGGGYAGLGAGYIAVSNTGVLSWASATGSLTNPMTATGDMIYSSDGAGTPVALAIGTTGQVLTVSAGGIPEWTTVVGTGSVTDASVVTANGFAGSVATSTTTPAITISTTITGIIKGNGTAISAATANVDYMTNSGNTTGSAATLTTSRNINGVAFNGSADITVTAAAGTLTGSTLASNVLTSSLTTVGVIGAGTWQGTAIATGFGGVPSAGTTGQILRKNSNTNYDYSWSSLSAGTVTNVTGTANRITVATGTTTPVIDIAATYIGQTSITTLGTISTGSWNATSIPINKGGTGFTAANTSTILIGNAGGTWTQATPTGFNGITVTMGSGTMSVGNVYNSNWQTLTDGATITWNVASGANGRVTLNGTGRAVTIPAPVDGHVYTMKITQGSGGLKTITSWPATTRWVNNTPPDLSDAAGAVDFVSLKYEAATTTFWGTYGYNFQ